MDSNSKAEPPTCMGGMLFCSCLGAWMCRPKSDELDPMDSNSKEGCGKKLETPRIFSSYSLLSDEQYAFCFSRFTADNLCY